MDDPDRLVTALVELAAELAGDVRPERRHIGAALGRWVDLRGSFAETLGLENESGRPWRRTIGQSRRTALICDAAARFWPDMSAIEQAHRLAAALRHYRDARWPRTRTAAANPHEPQSLDALCWQLIRLDGGQSIERIRKVLVTNPPCS